MAEWSIAAVLKTVELRGSGGSNPSFSAESSKSCFLRFMEAGCFLIYIINRKGEMLEWLKRHAWKACIPLKGIGGSNPPLSATNAENQQIAKQTPSFTPKNVKSGVFVLFKIIQPLHNKRVAILKESDEKRLIFIYPFTLIFQDFTSS